MRRILIIAVVALVFTNCVKIGEYYVGLNMQPDLSDSPFEPGLNVFGVVKCGTNFDTVNYHFEVQNMLDLMDWSAGLEVNDAIIELKRTTKNGDEFSYNLEFLEGSTYGNSDIETSPGDYWEYRCVKDSFEVTATCLVPNFPVVYDAHQEGTEFQFGIKKDSTAFLYVVYLIQGEHVQTVYKIPDLIHDTAFNINIEWDTDSNPMHIYVCAYDLNLREYQTTSNTFFKPNAFRPSFSTVEGGYGTFGAVAIVQLPIYL